LAASAVQPARQVIAGNGLTGGGSLAADVTLNVGAGTGITVAADTVGLDATTQSRLLIGGGTTSQVLQKASNTDYDVTWATVAAATAVSYAPQTLTGGEQLQARTNIGLSNVDNTNDANKPVSTATQTALNLKANLASPALTGVPTAPTATVGTNTTQIATTAFVLANAVISKSYTSAEQTITSAGSLTLAHGLGAEPSLIAFTLVCKTSEFGYSVNDKLYLGPVGTATSIADQSAFACTYDGTNVYIRYGAATNVFSLLNKSTGTGSAFTNGNWRLVVKALA